MAAQNQNKHIPQKQNYQELHKEFLGIFKAVALYKHRYDVFRDFVTMSAITLRNALVMNDALEQEYLGIIKGYKKEDQLQFPKLLALLVALLEFEPRDVLGNLFEALELTSKDKGQFFTPQPISEFMAQILGEQLGQRIDQWATVARKRGVNMVDRLPLIIMSRLSGEQRKAAQTRGHPFEPRAKCDQPHALACRQRQHRGEIAYRHIRVDSTEQTVPTRDHAHGRFGPVEAHAIKNVAHAGDGTLTQLRHIDDHARPHWGLPDPHAIGEQRRRAIDILQGGVDFMARRRQMPGDFRAAHHMAAIGAKLPADQEAGQAPSVRCRP
ncbi:MAG: hypothetical protein U5M50_05045 [Sphingobium sp.]|nr:hypothetical protein [Sphingobium sp.]